MSRIVLGVGTSHSPLLAMSPSMWVERARDDLKRTSIQLGDGRVVSYAQLAQETGERYASQATLAQFEAQSRRAQASLDRLVEEIAAARPDVIVVIGDDQDELFKHEHMPAVAVFYGAQIVMHPHGEAVADLPAWHQQALRGYSQDKAHVLEGAPDYALALIDGLLERGVDVAAASRVKDPLEAGFGHAFGFVQARLLGERTVPMVPVMLNTYFAPNVMRPWRCHEAGRALRQAIEAIPDDRRIAIVASGGLSHFATDEPLDRGVLDALAAHDAQVLRSLPVSALRSGSSEILNWVMAGGALEGLAHAWTEYIPVYRTPAGTGIGLAFAVWRP
ncbi:protocatechuate 3,4-dioxygenase [Paraburkholderia sp. J67]|uniref:DODA-type extradiol aromatic ring-opening family dioxygenase n=1 Tax=Paraburkholderia sp. J67 TaxID=2805435 RepID=UPI002ABDE691|nr:protocatechuate 3,4-dioxygenase [Paraburkholderia sp. J67]